MINHDPVILPVLPPGLAMLFEEMQALMGILPANTPATPEAASARAQDVAQFEEEAVEAGFDNMPV